MKFIKFVAAAATGILLSTGIAAAEDKPVVGLIMKSLANEFFQNIREGAEAHAKARGDYELRAVGMQNETDFESQINAVENFITQGFDAIVVAPADSKAMARPLKRAMEAGIVVVHFDVALDEDARKQQCAGLVFVGPQQPGRREAC